MKNLNDFHSNKKQAKSKKPTSLSEEELALMTGGLTPTIGAGSGVNSGGARGLLLPDENYIRAEGK